MLKTKKADADKKSSTKTSLKKSTKTTKAEGEKALSRKSGETPKASGKSLTKKSKNPDEETVTKSPKSTTSTGKKKRTSESSATDKPDLQRVSAPSKTSSSPVSTRSKTPSLKPSESPSSKKPDLSKTSTKSTSSTASKSKKSTAKSPSPEVVKGSAKKKTKNTTPPVAPTKGPAKKLMAKLGSLSFRKNKPSSGNETPDDLESSVAPSESREGSKTPTLMTRERSWTPDVADDATPDMSTEKDPPVPMLEDKAETPEPQPAAEEVVVEDKKDEADASVAVKAEEKNDLPPTSSEALDTEEQQLDAADPPLEFSTGTVSVTSPEKEETSKIEPTTVDASQEVRGYSRSAALPEDQDTKMDFHTEDSKNEDLTKDDSKESPEQATTSEIVDAEPREGDTKPEQAVQVSIEEPTIQEESTVSSAPTDTHPQQDTVADDREGKKSDELQTPENIEKTTVQDEEQREPQSVGQTTVTPILNEGSRSDDVAAFNEDIVNDVNREISFTTVDGQRLVSPAIVQTNVDAKEQNPELQGLDNQTGEEDVDQFNEFSSLSSVGSGEVLHPGEGEPENVQLPDEADGTAADGEQGYVSTGSVIVHSDASTASGRLVAVSPRSDRLADIQDLLPDSEAQTPEVASEEPDEEPSSPRKSGYNSDGFESWESSNATVALSEESESISLTPDPSNHSDGEHQPNAEKEAPPPVKKLPRASPVLPPPPKKKMQTQEKPQTSVSDVALNPDPVDDYLHNDPVGMMDLKDMPEPSKAKGKESKKGNGIVSFALFVIGGLSGLVVTAFLFRGKRD